MPVTLIKYTGFWCDVSFLVMSFWRGVPFLATPFWHGISCDAVSWNTKSARRVADRRRSLRSVAFLPYDATFGAVFPSLQCRFGVVFPTPPLVEMRNQPVVSPIGEAYDVVFGVHLMIEEALRRRFGVNSMYPLGRERLCCKWDPFG